MNKWCHLPTSIRCWRVLHLAILSLTIVAFITTLIFANVAQAAPGTNQTINFQGRLLNSAGGVVSDGQYNMQFKIYQDGTGTAANNPDGSLKWTETYANNGVTTGVEVKNGFFSVSLGSVTPFGTSVDWNQDTLWLSMNVAGSSAGCTTFGTSPCAADGEMLPMKRMTSTPFAMNAARLGGIDASGFMKNSTSLQSGDFNISGSGTATSLQGTNSVSAPLFDRTSAGTLGIGTTNATTINVGTNDISHTIKIGTGIGDQTVVVGSKSGASSTLIQGGTGGIRLESEGGIGFRNVGAAYDALTIDWNNSINTRVAPTAKFEINTSADQSIFLVQGNGNITTSFVSAFNVQGTAKFERGLTIQGDSGALTYATPGGYNMKTAINIPNYRVGDYESIFAFGLPATSSATARGMLIADGRTFNHQATIGVLSPDENNIFGLSWNGSNTVGAINTTGNSLALQGNGLNILTANNSGGQARVGIGNAGTSGYSLDVTGDTNTSSQYRIGGSTALTSSALSFSGASASSVTSAAGQALNLNGANGVNIQTGGTTRASFSSTQIKVGAGTGVGTPVLLTVDRASTAPTGSAGLLGSMYYDTTVGKVQCYEAAGWGDCGSAPDSFVTISPEYAGAVMNGAAIGTITSDLCSDMLNINDGSSGQPTICGTNETYNFYKWNSAETTAQTRSIFVSYQLPSNFKQFVAGTTSLKGRTDSTNSTVNYQVYRDRATGLTACGSAVAVSTGAQTTWQTGTAATTADPANCSFAAGDSIFFRINLSAQSNANAYVSNLKFTFSNN